MKHTPLSIPDIIVFSPRRFLDDRGYFSETFKLKDFQDRIGQPITFVQDNTSFSKSRGTVRGLHCQSTPFGQGKLVQCLRGTILDIAVDFRENSTTFGHWACAKLSAQNGKQMWIPEDFLHGYVTLEDNCQIAYKCTNYYNKDHEHAVLWNDPDLNIDWQIEHESAIISDKDARAPLFADLKPPFIIKGDKINDDKKT